MSNAERDTRIAEPTTQADSLRSQMETPSRLCLDAAKKFLAGRFEEEADTVIGQQPEAAERNGPVGLKKVLIANIPSLVDQTLGSSTKCWSHKLQGSHELNRGMYHVQDNNLPDFLKSEMGRLLETVGKLLFNHGFNGVRSLWCA